MCGRFTREFTWREVHDFLDLKWPGGAELAPSWNVAPTQISPVARVACEGAHRGERQMALMRWGLVPFWAQDVSIGSKMINARAEGIEAKPAFRAAFKSRRCIVPVSGFYEWKKGGAGPKGPKQPYYIFPTEGRILGLAGLWEQWDHGDGPLETFTIITTTPNEMMSRLHDRMPVILDPADFGRWLNAKAAREDTLALLRPAPEGTLDCREVGSAVSSPRNDGRELIQGAGLF
ncbi:MAG: SOS response-associated peptidase [Phycisphaerales bacterium]|nr:SOS response-associated peptidase [Phycisphaerales bacterium]